MKNDNNNRRSPYYQFTIFGVNDELGKLKLAELKQSIAVANQRFGKKRRVCVKGRLGRNNPLAYLYRNGGPRQWAAKSGAILLAHAGYFDVYVYAVSGY